MTFVGVHPVLMHVPPRLDFSTSATRQPRSASRRVNGFPACPEPIMIASYFMDGRSKSKEPDDDTQFGEITQEAEKYRTSRPTNRCEYTFYMAGTIRLFNHEQQI